MGLYAQETLKKMEPLMGKTWSATGNWGDGSKFKQETVFSYSLDSTLVIANSKGFTNTEQTEYGDRNHGIRKFDAGSNSYIFWEFDVFGGLTQGRLVFKGKNILYHYDYGGETITDAWEYVNPNTYNFKVGSYNNGAWKEVYLDTQFVAVEKEIALRFDHQSIVVTDLGTAGNFYRDILKLTEIEHPDKAPGFRWFQIRENMQLHLIEKGNSHFSKDKSIHLALATDNLENMIQHLHANAVPFYDWPGNKGAVSRRTDGVQQIYVQDPEGYWIEINTAKQ